MIRGLVVGKFAPLHRGHALLVSTALSQCDELLILSYTSQVLHRCDADRRRRWLEKSFPTARIVVIDDQAPKPDDASEDEVQRAFVAALLSELHFIPTLVFSSEAYGAPFAQYLSRAFSQPVGHVSVDQSRARIPVSATAIRANIHAMREWLAPHVYADFVERIAFLGAESTGKTTLGKWLAQARGTHYVPEYGRAVWEANKGVLRFPDLLRIAQGQVEREDQLALSAKGYLVCDTSPLTTLFYCLNYFESADQQLVDLAARSYDHCVLLIFGAHGN